MTDHASATHGNSLVDIPASSTQRAAPAVHTFGPLGTLFLPGQLFIRSAYVYISACRSTEIHAPDVTHVSYSQVAEPPRKVPSQYSSV